MEKETIMNLYYGKINPLDMGMVDDEEYREHCRLFMQGAQSFAKKLTPELKIEFEKLCEEEQITDEFLHRDGFCKGFQTGLKLTAEALLDNQS